MTVMMITPQLSSDAQTTDDDLIEEAIESRGGDVVRIEIGTENSICETPLAISPGNKNQRLGEQIDEEDITGIVWFPHLTFDVKSPKHIPAIKSSPRTTMHKLSAYERLFDGFVQSVKERDNVAVLPSGYETKFEQYRVFDSKEIPYPDTVVTNSVREAREFYESYDQVISKSLTKAKEGRLLKQEHFDGGEIQKIENAPLILQEFIPGTDLRALVVDGELVCTLKFDSDEPDYAQVPLQEVGLEKTTLSPSIRDTVVRATEEVMDYNYGAVDLIETEDGACYVLEINPYGEIYKYETNLDVDISGPLADLLLNV